MGQGNPKELAKAHGNAEFEWVEEAQGKEIGQRCLRRKKWVKEAHKQCNGSGKTLSSMNASPTILLGHGN